VIGAAKLRKWEGEFAFARIEGEDGLLAPDTMVVLSGSANGELEVTAETRSAPVECALRVTARAAPFFA
jgi:hypothetical protein